MTYCIDWQLDPALGLRVPVINLEGDAEARRALANAATIESFALLQMLQREQQREREEDMFEYVFTTTIRRLVELNNAVCGALSTGPGIDSPATIADMIFGSDGWRDSRDPGDVAPTAKAGQQTPSNTDPPRDDEPLLADPARAAIVSDAVLGLFDKLHEMKEAIGSGGRGGRARQVWTAGFHALERRASVILSAADDSIESTVALAERLAALPRVLTEEERGEQRAQSSTGARS